jgi:hypothetical protein
MLTRIMAYALGRSAGLICYSADAFSLTQLSSITVAAGYLLNLTCRARAIINEHRLAEAQRSRRWFLLERGR